MHTLSSIVLLISGKFVFRETPHCLAVFFDVLNENITPKRSAIVF